mgnify:CR=1 FL=1
MSKTALHPVVEGWFRSRFGDFTPIQKKALRHTLRGENALILAPTGSGKTLAAFLSVLSDLMHAAQAPQGLPNATVAVYVSPLKALGRDICRNLELPLEVCNGQLAADRQIRMSVRTGDTELKDRARQQRDKPHLLLTTPESLSTVLSQAAWRTGGFDARTIIVDEIHALAENKRGTLLALAMERLEARGRKPLQRIGLSATAWPVEAVTGFMCGARPCAVASVDLRKAHRLDIAVPSPDRTLPPAGHSPYRAAAPVAELVEHARCSLVFTTTRSATERLALALKILLPEWDDLIEVHHGSVDREARLRIEEGLSAGKFKAVVCSSSLELGVDFSAVDQVLLIGAPRGVSRAMQRLGRSGHRVDGVAQGSLVAVSLPDLIECVALREGASAGHLDPLRPPRAPLDVLAQVLLAMSIERPWSLDEAYELVCRSAPYAGLARADFDAVIEYLTGGGRVLGAYETYGKIVVEDGTFRVTSKKVARAFYMNAGVISDDYQIKIVSRGNRRLGEVEEGFLSSLQPGEAFIIGGRSVAVKTMHQNMALVEPAKGERVVTPRWMGSKMALTIQLANEELRLRRDLRSSWERGGGAECIKVLRREWEASPEVAARIAAYVGTQYQAAPVPVDSPVQVERVRAGRTMLLLFHVVAGRDVARSLAWVTGSRLIRGGSVVANFDDHGFLLSIAAKDQPSEEKMREAFNPKGWADDLKTVLDKTESLGRRFRSVAEIGQLLPRRTAHGDVPFRAASWSGSLLYKTLLQYEPDHPLVRECVRGVMEDDCDLERSEMEARRIFETPFEIFDLPRPSPLALPLFAAFNREVLMSQDPDRALDDLVAQLYGEWEHNA